MDHSNNGTLEAAKAGGAILSGDIKSEKLKKLLHFHTAWPFNKKHTLPGHFIWYKFFLDESKLNRDDEIYFIFFEGFRLAYSRSYLRHLRKKFTRSKLIFCFWNPVTDNNLEKWETLKNFYDAGIALCRQDAIDHNLKFLDYWPRLLPEKKFQPENASDVFFVAQAKGRLPKILAVYERLRDFGLKCDFHVVGVPESEQKYSDVISYNKPIKYDEVLQRAANTKCVLEILPFGKSYSSLRVCEALWYHKKLLTTNLNAKYEWFYKPEIVKIFTDASEIDRDFIAEPLSHEDEERIFGNMKIGDFKIFAEKLMKLI